MKHTTFFILIEVLDRGIADCPQCHGHNKLEYNIGLRKIYCLDCDTKLHRLSDGNSKKFVYRSHNWLFSEFAGKTVKKDRFVSRVIWRDIWT